MRKTSKQNGSGLFFLQQLQLILKHEIEIESVQVPLSLGKIMKRQECP